MRVRKAKPKEKIKKRNLPVDKEESEPFSGNQYFPSPDLSFLEREHNRPYNSRW